jgi:hypothetical protein
MLELLKQLQVKPAGSPVQVEICNEKQTGDCPFLGTFTFFGFVLQTDRKPAETRPQEPALQCSRTFSEKRCKRLSLKRITVRTYSLSRSRGIEMADLEPILQPARKWGKQVLSSEICPFNTK